MAKKRYRVTTIGTIGAFANGRACSDTAFSVLDRALDPALDSVSQRERKPEERAAVPFAGGILQHGFQCGLVWGATLAAGAQAYRIHGPGPRAEAEAIRAAKRLIESFHSRNKHINCSDLTQPELKTGGQIFTYFFLKGGAIRCFHRAGQYAPAAFDEIHRSLDDASNDLPSSPASCSAMLAQKMGASDLHTVMAAGLAGGIGLCGGGCGALGTAIWLVALSTLNEIGTDNVWESSAFRAKAAETINRFLKSSGYEFECSAIVGRKFESPEDHSAYLREGGCMKILDALAGDE